MRIPLGSTVEDLVTGFKGVAENCASYLYGCDRYGVQPKVDKEGKIPDANLFDDMQLKVLKVKIKMPAADFPKQVVQLGDRVKCPVTELIGIATGRCLYLNGCARIYVETAIADKGKIEAKTFWTDELLLEIVKKKAVPSQYDKLEKAGKTPNFTGRRRTGGVGRSNNQKY